MIEKVKQYCYEQLKLCKQHGYDPKQAVTRCYGAVMFVLSIEPAENESTESLGWWWDNEMHPCFAELGAY